MDGKLGGIKMDFMNNGNGAATQGTGNFTLNLDAVDETKVGSGFPVMPKGDYDCIIEDSEFKYSATSNSPMLVFKYKVVDGEFAGRLLFHNCVLNKAFGIAMMKKVLVCSGVDVNMANFDPEGFADSGEIIGLPIRVTVGIGTYQGEKNNNVKNVSVSTPTGGGMFK